MWADSFFTELTKTAMGRDLTDLSPAELRMLMRKLKMVRGARKSSRYLRLLEARLAMIQRQRAAEAKKRRTPAAKKR